MTEEEKLEAPELLQKLVWAVNGEDIYFKRGAEKLWEQIVKYVAEMEDCICR